MFKKMRNKDLLPHDTYSFDFPLSRRREKFMGRNLKETSSSQREGLDITVNDNTWNSAIACVVAPVSVIRSYQKDK